MVKLTKKLLQLIFLSSCNYEIFAMFQSEVIEATVAATRTEARSKSSTQAAEEREAGRHSKKIRFHYNSSSLTVFIIRFYFDYLSFLAFLSFHCSGDYLKDHIFFIS